jgi:outer membrane protein TolC
MKASVLFKIQNCFVWLVFLIAAPVLSFGQSVLTLPQAVQTAVQNYGSIKAKLNYAKASATEITETKREYLPNLNFGAEQVFGTANGQNGPMYALGGLGVSSSGPATNSQNWNAGFGSLYLSNINWDFFAFGRAKEKVKTAEATAARDTKDWQQEIFQQQVKVAATYLKLLAAQRLTESWRKNLYRADTLRNVVVTRAKNGLNPGVDSAQANAEVANARISLTNAIDFQQEQSNILAQLMGVPAQNFTVDTLFVSKVPAELTDTSMLQLVNHPILQWYKSRITLSSEQEKYERTYSYPTFSLFGVLQTRGSGFGSNYTQNLHDYSTGYWNGTDPTRSNYLAGVGVTWNFTQTLRVSQQTKAQKFVTEGLQDEYSLADQQLRAQLALSKTKISNALDNYFLAPVQVKAAAQAYLQKVTLYRHGLTNLVDVTQAAYVLVRAETDSDIAYSNVWQALLLKAAAAGDFGLFINKL